MERFAQQAAAALNKVLSNPITTADLESPPDPTLGDFALPCFKLSKALRKAPTEIAKELSTNLTKANALPSHINVVNVGPYINFTISAQHAIDAIIGDVLKTADAGEENPHLGTYGKAHPNSQGTWVIEYSSPNVAKPFQIYHLRTTALGASLDRIGRYRGYNMVSINHLGDWGTQYGKLSVALKLFGDSLPKEPSIKDLVDIYVKFHTAAEKDPSLEDKAREAFLKLEQNDPEMKAVWEKSVDISLKEFKRIYERLNVKFDHIWGESFYKDMTSPLLQELRQKKLLIESEGALVVPVKTPEGKELPPCILQKKDGATIYATRDVAAAIYRFQRFHFDRMTYIVGAEQKLHFQQIFNVIKQMGYEWIAKCEHVATGLYRFKDTKMSTRKGNFVTLEEVLSLAKERAQKLMVERNAQQEGKSLSSQELETTSEAVAIGSVIFHDLHTDPVRDVDFDLERVVDFEGETGPYLQYAHTRCLSILRKAGATAAPIWDSALVAELKTPEEILLTKTLGQFPLHLNRSLHFSKASQLANYMIDVTKAFGAFYRERKVLTDDKNLTQARLCLVEATRRILGRGLSLLGIPLPEKM